MRSCSVAVVCSLVAAMAAGCAEAPHAGPVKRPNVELIVGEYERHPPDGQTAIRFLPDGGLRLAKSKAELDAEPPLASGNWKLDGDKLTLTYDKGACADAEADRTGVYTVVVSKIGVHFTKVEDHCARRASIDGQTWWRLR